MVSTKAVLYYYIVLLSCGITLTLLLKYNSFGPHDIILFGSNTIFNTFNKNESQNQNLKISTPGPITEIPKPQRPVLFVGTGIEGIKAAAVANYKYFHLKSFFICPAVGKFGLKGHCSNFYECARAGGKSESVSECVQPGHAFNRLSRTCEKIENVRCDWCEQQGRFADITSNRHFIDCFPGNIAFRYKCRFGAYDITKGLCEGSAGGAGSWKIALADPPRDIVAFMKAWNMMEEVSPAKLIQNGRGNGTVETIARVKLETTRRKPLRKLMRKIRSINNSKRNTEANPEDEEAGDNGQDAEDDGSEALNAFIAKQFGAKKKVYSNWNGTLATGHS